MSTTTGGPASGLPVRMPRPRQTGRHRRPEALSAPEGAPVLVLAVPGTPSTAALSLAEEVVSIARSELSGLDPRVGFVDGTDAEDAEFPSLRSVLDQVAVERAGEDVSAVVVPLLAGPEASVLRRVRQAVADSKAQVELTEVLGPHPLLAEALHVRLSEAGLARADRARLFTVATAADGIILATVGGEEAAQAAGVTGLLLAARLAVPVLAAALDEDGSIASAAEQLRSSGSGTLALAPCLIGPEIAPQVLHTAAEEAGCSAADALGPYPAVGKLVVTQYAAALGLAMPQQGSGVPMR
ncbi:sirohydrochlorin chelatase [Streptomyces sp. NPDC021224]|uniref:sirohydrochlorin chelatase n=1 Tax=unclassified Streptomyces TaxID=2593676 RepID=UPI0037A86D9D